MGITAVVIDKERTFADALAIRLNAEADVEAVAATRPAAANTGRPADVILLDADLAGSIPFCDATSRPRARPG